MKIRLDLTFLRDWQKDFIKKAKRFNVLVIHRRAGKTVVSVSFLLFKALQEPGSYGYIAPTYKQAKAIAWDMLKKMSKDIPGTKTNESELTLQLPNGSKIRLFGADNPDSLRGLDLKGVVFDEYAQQPANIYGEIVFPMINANNGWCIWIGTPKGKNAFYQLYAKATKDRKYLSVLLQASQSKLLTQDQLNAAKEEMTDEEYAQEYECSFEAAIKGAYYTKELSLCRNQKRIKQGLYDPLLPVFTFWDIGMSDYMAILFVQIHGNTVRVIDSLQHNGEGFGYYAAELKQRGYDYEMHFFPHDIQVRELTTGQSRLEIVRDLLGISKVQVLPKLAIMDGINGARRIFHNIWFEEDKTIALVEAISLYRQKYDEKRDLFLQQPEHDWTSHFADAFRYMAVGYNMMLDEGDDEIPIEIDFGDEI